jgi:hypothetical protein
MPESMPKQMRFAVEDEHLDFALSPVNEITLATDEILEAETL